MGATIRHPYYTKLEDPLARGTISVNEGEDVAILNISFADNDELWARGTIAQSSGQRSSRKALI
eukprot:2507541-Pyramimonas_sp.AAC.1